jgi:hypothetical protein
MPVLHEPSLTVLFDGSGLNRWTSSDGSPARWSVDAGELRVVPGKGDIVTVDEFDDFQLHIEFRCPDVPGARGQKKGNSGLFLQGRYEIQILDSYGAGVPGTGDCGAVYGVHAPLVNACLPAGEWQTFDVFFRSVRPAGERSPWEAARLTVLQNGVVIHNNVVLDDVTKGAARPLGDEPGPIVLQDHGDPVAFRNIWIGRLPQRGSNFYEARWEPA